MQNSLFPLVLVTIVNCEQWLGYIQTAYIVFFLKDLKPNAALMKSMCQRIEKVAWQGVGVWVWFLFFCFVCFFLEFYMIKMENKLLVQLEEDEEAQVKIGT